MAYFIPVLFLIPRENNSINIGNISIVYFVIKTSFPLIANVEVVSIVKSAISDKPLFCFEPLYIV